MPSLTSPQALVEGISQLPHSWAECFSRVRIGITPQVKTGQARMKASRMKARCPPFKGSARVILFSLSFPLNTKFQPHSVPQTQQVCSNSRLCTCSFFSLEHVHSPHPDSSSKGLLLMRPLYPDPQQPHSGSHCPGLSSPQPQVSEWIRGSSMRPLPIFTRERKLLENRAFLLSSTTSHRKEQWLRGDNRNTF